MDKLTDASTSIPGEIAPHQQVRLSCRPLDDGSLLSRSSIFDFGPEPKVTTFTKEFTPVMITCIFGKNIFIVIPHILYDFLPSIS